MSEAPHHGTPVRLHLRDGSDFVGCYSDRWWGWVALLDPWPLIRGDIKFTGWEPVADEELRQIRQQLRVPPAAVVATAREPEAGDRQGPQAQTAALMSSQPTPEDSAGISPSRVQIINEKSVR